MAVVGAGEANLEDAGRAEEVGRLLAEAGAVVVCGGLGGTMEAVCRGCTAAGGISVGILPGRDRRQANPWVTAAVATGLGEARNSVVVSSADVVIAIGGEYGTLSEIAMALKIGRPVVGLNTWALSRPDGTREQSVLEASDPGRAVDKALELAGVG